MMIIPRLLLLALVAGGLASAVLPPNVRQLFDLPLVPAASIDASTSTIAVNWCGTNNGVEEGCEPATWNFLTQEFPAVPEALMPGPASSMPQDFTADGSSTVYFTAQTAALGREVYRMRKVFSNDTWSTALLADVAPGPTSSEPSSLILLPGTPYLFFAAEVLGSGYGRELYCVDSSKINPLSSPLATAMLAADINPGSNSSNPDSLTVFDGMLFFSAEGGPTLGLELFALIPASLLNATRSSLRVIPSSWWPWSSLTATPLLERSFVVRLVSDTAFPGSGGSGPTWLTALSSWDNRVRLLYFQATSPDPEVGAALFVCNCNATSLVNQWWQEDLHNGYGLNVTVPTPNATITASFSATPSPPPYRPSPSPIIGLAAVIETNRTAAIESGGAIPIALTAVGGKTLYFSAFTREFGRELWSAAIPPGQPSAAALIFNLSAAFTNVSLVADVNPGPDSSNPSMLLATQQGANANSLYWTAFTPDEGFELHGLSPAEANTLPGPQPAALAPLFDLLDGSNGSYPEVFVESAGSLIFSVVDGGNGSAASFILSQQPNGTPLPTITATPTNTPSTSVTANFTVSATFTPSISFSASNTSTVTPVVSPTGTSNASVSYSGTETPSPTANATITGTANASISLSGTGTRTPSFSISFSSSISPSPLTLSNTASLTNTVSRSFTSTRTQTASSSETPTPTSSLSAFTTPSSSVTALATISRSMAATSPFPTRTPDSTTSPRPTPLRTPTSSLSASATPSSGGFVPDAALIDPDATGPDAEEHTLAVALGIGLGLGLLCLLCCAWGAYWLYRRKMGPAEAHTGLLVTKKPILKHADPSNRRPTLGPGGRSWQQQKDEEDDEDDEDAAVVASQLKKVTAALNYSGSRGLTQNPIALGGGSSQQQPRGKLAKKGGSGQIGGSKNKSATTPFGFASKSALSGSAFDDDDDNGAGDDDDDQPSRLASGRNGQSKPRFSVMAIPVSPTSPAKPAAVKSSKALADRFAFAAGDRADLRLGANSSSSSSSNRQLPPPPPSRPSMTLANPLAAGRTPGGRRQPEGTRGGASPSRKSGVELVSPRL